MSELDPDDPKYSDPVKIGLELMPGEWLLVAVAINKMAHTESILTGQGREHFKDLAQTITDKIADHVA
jgi:hypothetical protein